MGRKKYGHCSRALEEDAPKVLGHGSIFKWAVAASEWRTPWSVGVPAKWREKMYVGNQYILHRNSTGGGNNLFIFYSIEDEDKWPPPCALRRLYPCAAPRRCPFVVVVRRSSSPPSPPSLSPMLCLIVVCNFFPSL